MKLEKGMFVRTEFSIGKLLYFNEELEEWVNEEYNSYTEDFIVKASHNIIDLIEAGDYVNGYIVLDIIKDNLGKTYIECGCKDEIAHNYIYDTFYNEDIKSIVTKEQMEAIQYVVK